jgi:hypothetical protein
MTGDRLVSAFADLGIRSLAANRRSVEFSTNAWPAWIDATVTKVAKVSARL